MAEEREPKSSPVVYHIGGGGGIGNTLLALGVVGGLGAAAYLLFFNKGLKSVKVTKYTNETTQQSAVYPNVLSVNNGDTIAFEISYSYSGPEMVDSWYLALGYPAQLGWNETGSVTKSFMVPSTTLRKTYTDTIRIVANDPLFSDTGGVYVKLLSDDKVRSQNYDGILLWGGTPPPTGFSFGTPSATPSSQDESQPVQLNWPITNLSASPQTTKVVFNIYENDLSLGTGPLITSIIVDPVVFAPNETRSVSVSYIEDLFDLMPARTFSSRNLGIEVWQGGVKVATWNVTGLFTITGGESGYTLQLAASPGIWAGAIVTNPDKPRYLLGEQVQCTAGPIWPYAFDHWEKDGVVLVDDWEVPIGPVVTITIFEDTVLTAFFVV